VSNKNSVLGIFKVAYSFFEDSLIFAPIILKNRKETQWRTLFWQTKIQKLL
jgi:hypothetical protein